MVQPPIIDDGRADTNNAFPQSCDDFHVKTALTVCPGGTKSMWTTPCWSKKQMSMDLCLDFIILAFFGRGKEGSTILSSAACSLGHIQTSTSRYRSLQYLKKSRFSLIWWRRCWQIAFRLAFCSSDNIRGTNFAYTFLMAKFFVTISKTWIGLASWRTSGVVVFQSLPTFSEQLVLLKTHDPVIAQYHRKPP